MRNKLAIAALLALLAVPLYAQTIRPTRISQVQFTELTTAQEAGMTLAEGSFWYNTDLGCYRYRSATTTTCVAGDQVAGVKVVGGGLTTIQAAIDALPVDGGKVFIPAGTYTLTTGLTITSDNITLWGAGPRQTTITTSTAGLTGITVGDGATTTSRVTIRDLYVENTNATPTGAGISLDQANTIRILNVNILGFSTDLNISGGTFNVQVDNFLFEDYDANGVLIDNATNAAVGLFLSNGIISNATRTVGDGIHWKEGGGVYVSNVDILEGNRSVLISPQAGEIAQWGFFTNVTGDTSNGRAWSINPAGSGQVLGITMVNCWAASSITQDGILIAGNDTSVVDGIRWLGGKILNNDHHGVLINGGGTTFKNISIDGSDIGNNSQEAGGTWHGIAVAANASEFSLRNNRIGDVLNGSSTQQGWAILIAAGTSNNYVITSNDLRGNNSGGLSDGGTGTAKQIFGNLPLSTATSTLEGPLEGALTNSPRWIFKLVDHTDMTAAATADTFTLWTLPANTMIHDVVGNVVVAWAGTGPVSAAVASVGTAAGPANGLALDDNFFATGTRYELHDGTAVGGKGSVLFDSTDKFAPHLLLAGGVIELQMDLTGGNHSTTSAGQARIYILVSSPLGNTTTEAN